MNSCPKCGRETEEGDIYCRHCGARLGVQTTPVGMPSAPSEEEIKNLIVMRLDGIKNKDENTVRSIIDSVRYSKFDDWPPWSRQDAETGLKNEFGAFKVLKTYDYDFTNLKIDLMEDVAVATFQLHYIGQMRDQPFEVNSRVTTVLFKESAEWKIVHEHYSRMGGEQQQQPGRRRRWF
jgi:ketosteroid isomerase-like protein